MYRRNFYTCYKYPVVNRKVNTLDVMMWEGKTKINPIESNKRTSSSALVYHIH